MKNITPRLEPSKGYPADRWTYEGELWTCAEKLAEYFDIPKSVKAIWLRWSEKPSAESVKVMLSRKSYVWAWSIVKDRFGWFFPPINKLLNRIFPDAHHGDTHILHVEVLYE